MTSPFLRCWGAARRTPSRTASRARPRLLALEAREVPAITYAVAAGATPPGGQAQVLAYDASGAIVGSIDQPFPGFSGEVRVAIGDVNNDGFNDVVVAPGPGYGPVVRVFDGAALEGGIQRSLRDFYAFAETFTGGVYVACGLVTHPVGVDAPDPFADIIVGPGSGAPPIVNGFDGETGAQFVSFFAFPVNPENGLQFTGGVRVAVADVGGDNGGITPGGQGHEEIICGAGPGGNSHVTVWEYDNEFFDPDRFISFFAYEIGFTGGVYVGGGRFTNNMDDQSFVYEDIVTGPGEGGGPLMRIWSTDDASDRDNYILILTRSQFVYDPSLRNGLRVNGVKDLLTTTAQPPGSQNLPTIITSLGVGGAPINAINQAGLILYTTDTVEPPPVSELTKVGVLFNFATFDPTFLGGVYVGG